MVPNLMKPNQGRSLQHWARNKHDPCASIFNKARLWCKAICNCHIDWIQNYNSAN